MPYPSLHQHLVTVGDFAAFIDGGGYEDPALWSSEGWKWRLDHDIEAPRFWGEDEWAPYLEPRQPVVGVSWFEADAFATFRGWRLPGEAEWERACRGEDGRAYPWGNEWKDDGCPHRGTGRCTVSIGSFPPGPGGLYDLVGNVWQWTVDARGPDGDYGAPRIVCGGAWNNLPWSIGCAARNAFPPTARFSNLGFRCSG